MIAQGDGGRIINITSVHEDWPMPGNTAYCLSKGGMRMLTRTAGVELGVHGIRVNTVNPVVTLTPMAEKVWSEPEKSGPMLARIPLQRFVQPEEVARTIAYLLGSDSSMVNGVSLAVDGGFQAG